MTDHPTPTDDDLSLALDGEADAELLARIEADPVAQAQLEHLRAAATLLRDARVDPLDDEVVDGLIATAIDTPIAPARPVSGNRSGRATPWLVAAAVIVLMAIGLSLVWAGRSSDQDQASATKSAEEKAQDSGASSDGQADSAFSSGGGTAGAESQVLPGGHGAPTTAAATPDTASPSTPALFLGSYPSGAKLREATATSFMDAWKASGSSLSFDSSDAEGSGNARSMQRPPSAAAITRCADLLQVTLTMKAPPVQTGYATVDDEPVLVYEFATTSARTNKETTLVAAVGVKACDEVVFFER